MTARLRALRELARVQARSVLVYRADYVFGLIGVLVQVFLLRVVWTSVYEEGGHASVGGVALSTQIAYATFASVQHWLLSPWVFSTAQERIREGKIAIDLTRPVPFLQQTLAGQVGATAAMLPFVLVALPFAIVVGGAEAPESAGTAVAYALSLVLAYLISTLLNALVGMVAFWTLEVQGIFMIYRMTGQFLAGVLVPLWFMPDWLRTVAQWLPFQATTYTPLGIYLGRLSPGIPLLTQGIWVLVLALALRLVWSRALRVVIVQGG